MEREILLQYTDLVKEEKEIRHRISRVQDEIARLERRISEMDENAGDYQRVRADLMIKKMILSQRTALLTTLKFEILEKTNDVESYIASIDNSYMRRLVSFRVVDGLKWEEVAIKMGGGNSEDSVKKAFYRFVG